MSDNQEIFKNFQQYEIDLDIIYDQFIKPLDSIRSFINVNSASNEGLFKKVSVNNIMGVSRFSIEEKYQESRIHAFFRMIGFPVIGNDNSFYNPGFDLNRNKSISLESKINIINNPKEGYYKFSKFKEGYYNDKVKKYFKSQDLDSSCYILSSYNIRDFSDFESKYVNPIDFEVEDQSYLITLEDSIGTPFLKYEDSAGDNPKTLNPKRYHFIFPFIVDGRIDISCSKKVAVPFVPDKTYLDLNEGYICPRPYIEKIIRERFDQSNNNKDLGQAFNDEINRVKLNKIYTSTDLIDKIYSSDIYGVSEKNQFNKFINISLAIVDKIRLSRIDIQKAQSFTYWNPMPSIDGPEYSIRNQNVYLQSAKNLQKKVDLDICDLQTKIIVNLLNTQLNKISNTNSQFNFDAFSQNVQDDNPGLGSTLESQIESLNKKRESICKKGADGLKTIELLTGEFSGLGLIDMIVIITSLYLVDKIYLLGLLDDDSFNRAKLILNFTEERASVMNSILEIQKKSLELYSIFQTTMNEYSKI